MPDQIDVIVTPTPNDQCDIAIAQYTIGQKCTPELLEEVRALANGAPVRATGPKYPTSWDLRPRRINLQTDANRIIIGIKCG
ncbi:peptidase inhibitor [Pseudomonas sp. R1-7]|uniref:peptidase inhibitor n=1 Tax=Pseudomonas sp. R1-7 TaxID=2817398 RepID=UPI003DA9CBA6